VSTVTIWLPKHCIKVCVNDFENRYGYKPLLFESFVDEAWSGSCYRAANWIKIGRTKGRGRQDKHKKQALSRKAIDKKQIV
jgi:hypothetical protein